MNMKFSILGASLLIGLSATSLAADKSPQSAMEYLKTTPATKYEIGKLSMEMTSAVFSQQLTGREIKGTNFEVKNFSVKEENGNLLQVIHLEGRARDMSEGQCTELVNFFKNDELFEELPEFLWSGLTGNQYDELRSSVKVAVQLISKENESFTLECS